MRRHSALFITTGLALAAVFSVKADEPAVSPTSGPIAQVAHPSTTSSLLSESNTRVLLKLQALLHDHQSTQALALANQTLVDQPDNGDILFLKASALTQLKKRSEAITVLKNLTERFPEMAAPYNNLASLYAAEGNLDDARRSLEKCIRAQPNYGIAQENLGDVYLALAQAAYTRALQLNPNDRALKLKIDKIKTDPFKNDKPTLTQPKEPSHGPS